MNDKQRAEFEKKAEYLGLDVRWSVCDSDYADGKTSDFWHIWQAAIASVVVELPNHEEYFMTSSLDSAVKMAIDKSGVRYE